MGRAERVRGEGGEERTGNTRRSTCDKCTLEPNGGSVLCVLCQEIYVCRQEWLFLRLQYSGNLAYPSRSPPTTPVSIATAFKDAT